MDRLPIDRKSPIMLLNTADVNASSFAPIRNELQTTPLIAPTVVTRHSVFQQPSKAVSVLSVCIFFLSLAPSREESSHCKPRRCSTTFFDEERRILDQRRRKVRGIYDGSYTSLANCDLSDMPPNLPAPLVVGMKVYARLRTPKDGIYGGTIDALVSGGGGYRIVFDKEDMIPPSFVPDYEVMYDGSLELLSLSYFLQQNNARLPVAVCSTRTVPVTYPPKQRKSSEVNHEKVGNFPVRMLVILVKVAKLLDIKRKLVKTLTELNNEAERESILTDKYTSIFQERYARTVVDLETVNRQVNIYLNGIQEYNTQLLPQLSELRSPVQVSISARPEALRRMCASHANQIFKHCNRDLNVSNPQAVRLITALTSLLLQIRSLGQQKMTPMDLTALSESINEIRQMVTYLMFFFKVSYSI
ncbi:dirp [Ancylostoma ceylanicum]|uniref:Dirp n=1 Tax=Ancylostoma ceylanicum TaxID=53326 RepID=A0A0D6LXE8_9BILA|nr:dirp [Ancylostoma ceylanicum]